MKTILLIVLKLLAVAAVAVVGYLHFQVWRLKHPQAPTWTYFL